ncbi:MAG: PEP-CTERM sorting domain-containing protein [Tepidisphaerales bacterium]
MTRFTTVLIGVLGAGLALLSGMAGANETLQIDDTTEGNVILIPGVGNVNAGVVPGTVVELPEHLTFEYQWNANAPAVIPAGTTDSVGMLDPVTEKLSDVLQFFTVGAGNGTVTYKFDFYSDDEFGNFPAGAILKPDTSIDESGAFQTLGFFGIAPNQMELQAASDVEVPEPGALGLLGLGALGLLRRRQRASKSARRLPL